MKKQLQILSLLLAFCLPWLGQAQGLEELVFSTGTDTAKWIPLTTTTSVLTGSGDGTASPVCNLGFTFPFGPDSYTQFSVNSDGNMRLGSTVTGTGSYSSPFSSSSAGTNSPKINMFGCDGYKTTGNYVYYEHTVDANGDSVGVVEFCMGTYNSTTRNYLYKWQIHLYHSGVIECVFGAAPAAGPNVSQQRGMCINASDGWIIDGTNNATHFTNGSSTTWSTGAWPEEGRYYRFDMPNMSCPRPINFAATYLTIDSAILTWHERGSATSWVVEYDSVDFVPGAGLANIEYPSDTMVVLTGLEPGVTYKAYLHADCGAGDTSANASLTFTTLAALPATLPFSCDFEGDGTDGWDLINGTQANGWYVGTGASNGGSKGLYISNTNGSSNGYNTGSESYTYAVRVLSLTEAGEYAYSFDWKNQGESNYYDYLRAFLVPASEMFEAGSCPAGSTYNFSTYAAPSTWFDISGKTTSPYTLANMNSWNTVSGTINITTPGTYKIVFAWANDGSGGNQPPAAVDNVVFVQNTCPQVANVTAVPAPEEVVLTWSAGGEETEWIVECDSVQYNTTDTTYTITGLTPNSEYSATIRAYCGVDDTSMVVRVNFRTPCMAVETDSLPYIMNFDTYSAPCWQLYLAESGMAMLDEDEYNCYVATDYSYSGPASLYMYGYSNEYGYAVLPMFEAELSTLQLRFRMFADYSPGFVRVGVMSNPADPSSFVQVAEFSNSVGDNWEEFDCNFLSAPADHPYIAFSVQPLGTASYYNYIDNVVVDILPTCVRPNALSVNGGSADSVVFSWTGNGEASAWQLAVGFTGFDPDTLTEVITGITDSVYVSALTAGQNFDAYVRTDCGDETSDWRGPVTFTPGLYLMHVSGSDTVRGCGLTIVDNGGIDNAYAANCNATLVVFPSEDSTLRVWGSSYTESTYDYVTIYDGIGTSGNVLYTDNGVSSLQSFGPFVSTSGPITITFHSDGSVFYDGFEIHTACVYMSDCVAPVAISADSVLGDTMWVSWTDTAMAGSYDLAFGLAGFDPDTAEVNVVTGISTTDYMLTGLTMGANHDVYVRADCGGEQSFWVGPASAIPGYFYQMQVQGVDTLRGCGYTITDDGGATGQYSGNCNSTLVVFPSDPSMTLMVSGNSYTESTFDYIRIYDGVGTGGTQLWTDYNVSQYQTFSGLLSDEGAVTITFQSDGSVFYDGFEITVQCVPLSNCPRPTNFTLAGVADESADFSWDETGTATNWQLEYGPAGFTPGSEAGTIVFATSNPWTITGLTPGTNYDVYLSADCDGELSNTRMLTFRTACSPIDSLPYFYGFEGTSTTTTATIDPCWRKGTNNSTAYPYPSTVAATGSRSLYFYAYYSSNYYSYAAMPLFADSLNTLQVSFKIRQSTSTYSYYAHNITVGVMTDPNNISTFTPIQTYSATSGSTWDEYTCYLAAYDGPGRYIAFKAQAPNSTQYYDYVYLDDVTVDYAPECGPVDDLTVRAGATSALVTWTPSTVGQYNGATVEYSEASDTSWTSVTTTDAYVVLSGLTVNTDYMVRVTNECVDGQAMPVSATFHTGDFGCLEPDTTVAVIDTVGYATGTTNSYLPSYSFYGNGLSQQIYLASELTGLGQITGMKLHTSAAAQTRTWTIYLAHTSQTSVDQWIVPDQMVAVWSGSVNYVSGGWVNFNFTTPFSYNGSDNLLLIVDDHTNSYVSGNYTYVHSLPGGRVSRYVYRDGSAYDPTDPSAAGTGTSVAQRCNVIFNGYGCAQTATCAAPIVGVNNVTPYTANIFWAPGDVETSWDVEYKLASANNWTSVGTVGTNSYQLTGLNQGVGYNVRVINTNCGDSLMGMVSFTTECAEINSLPYSENFDNWATGSGMVPNCWNREGSYSSYPYISANTGAGYDHTTGAGHAMYFYTWSTSASPTFLSLPAVDSTLASVNQLQAVFYLNYPSTSSYTHGIIVGVCNERGISSFVPVDTVMLTTSGTNNWEIFEVPLDRYTGTGRNITFMGYTTTSYGYPYFDDLTIELIPSCPRPDSLTASNATTSSVDLGWHERGGATDWIIEYGPVGFELGTGTVVAATSNPFTLTGLPSSYDGEYYVRSVCSSTDTGLYSRVACRFSTTQIAATLPYTCDFEGTEASAWQTSSNSNINWFVGTADAFSPTHSMYVSADNGTTVGNDGFSSVVNASAYRDIDFGTVDSSFTFTFKAKAGGTLTAAYDGLMVFLVDPTVPVISSSANITCPWGNVNDLYRIATVRLDTTWRTYTASFDTIHGIQRVAFFWFNQSTGASYPYIGGPAEVDDITIDYSACPRPVNMELVSTTSTSATLTWDGPSSASYRVVYRPATGTVSDNIYLSTNTNSINITGLTSLGIYHAWVQKICGSDTSLFSDGVEFQTDLCDGAVYDTIGNVNSSTTSYYQPLNNFYRYTLTQTIIDSAELAAAGITDITAIAYQYAYATASTAKTNCSIYLAHTTMSSFSSTSDMVPLDNTFVKVWEGDLSCQSGWNLFGFDTTFVWDGHSNILVCVDDNSNDYDGSAYTFYVTETSSDKSIDYYSDTYDPDITSPYPYSGSTYTRSYRPNMMLISCGGTATCGTPVITGETHDYQSATITWSGSGNSYEVAVKETAASTWPEAIAVTGTTYTFSGLNPATNYSFRVRQDCTVDSLGFSEWANNGFITDSLPCLAPDSLRATDVTNATATLDWNVMGNETNWDIHVWAAGFDSIYRVNAHPATVGGFTAGVTYNATVRALCGVNLLEGDWSDATQFTTATCPDVTGLTTSDVTAHSVKLSWTADPMAESWKIEYGYRGTPQGQGTVVTVNTNTYTVTGLADETSYQFYVQAVCGTGWESEQWAEIFATTLASSGDDCDPVSDLTVTDITTNSAKVTWFAESGSTWNVVVPEAGVDVEVSEQEYALTGLLANTNYDVKVRTICDNGVYSDFVVTSFMTLNEQGIDDVDNMSCTIYPNPTSSATTISVSGVNGKVKIAIVDMNGRTVASETMECAADCEKTLDVENLAQGAYFVRITGESVNMVKKLVVR